MSNLTVLGSTLLLSPANVGYSGVKVVLRRGSLPGNLMADAILDSERPVRAMIVVAGNPLLSIGGGDRLRKAFEQLELLVCIDLYRNATGELAALRAAVHRHARAGGPQRRQHRPVLPAVRAVHGAGRRAGAASAGRSGGSATGCCRRSAGRRCSTTSTPTCGRSSATCWRRASASTSTSCAPTPVRSRCPTPEPGRSSTSRCRRRTAGSTAARRCSRPRSSAAHAIFAELAAEPRGLKLITRRDAWMMNSWFRNVPRMTRRGRDDNPLFMHPDDAAERGLAEGVDGPGLERARRGRRGDRFDPDLMPGVVAMAHGWGNRGTSGMRVAPAASRA